MAMMSIMLIGILFIVAAIGVACLIVALVLFIIYIRGNKNKTLFIVIIVFTSLGVLGVGPLFVLSIIGRIASLFG